MHLLPLSVLLALSACASAKNPIVSNEGVADPHIHQWHSGGLFYLYSTHDFSPNNTGFLMKDWRVWTSPDLVAWTNASTLLPQDTPAPPGAYDECWATDGAMSPDGSTFFFYLSIGGDQVAVVSSTTSPAGPWNNSLGRPLINSTVGPSLNPPTTSRDPCVFQDDDGSHYIIFGVFEYYIAKLGDDLMSLAEAPRHVTVNNQLGPYGPGKMDDKPFLHKYGGNYYLSWGCFYGTAATSVYGPYTFVGSAIQTSALDPAFRMNVSGGDWWAAEDLADRHGSFWSSAGQSYYASNDRSHSTDKINPGVYRDTVIGYVNYYANGTIAPVAIDGTGVGEYDASEFIEAENFFALAPLPPQVGSAAVRVPASGPWKGHDSEGRFGIHGVTAETSATYPHVRNVVTGKGAVEFVVVAANGNADPATVVLRVGSAADGPVVCRAKVGPTGSWEAYGEARCTSSSGGEQGEGLVVEDVTLTLTFEGEGAGEILRVDKFAVVA
jgi:arabinoxylan arabinofuranohydrolase